MWQKIVIHVKNSYRIGTAVLLYLFLFVLTLFLFLNYLRG